MRPIMLEDLKFLESEGKIEAICIVVFLIFSHLYRFYLHKGISGFACRFSGAAEQFPPNPLPMIFLQYAHHI